MGFPGQQMTTWCAGPQELASSNELTRDLTPILSCDIVESPSDYHVQ